MVHNPLTPPSFAVNTALYISGTGSPRNFTHQNAKSYKTTRRFNSWAFDYVFSKDTHVIA